MNKKNIKSQLQSNKKLKNKKKIIKGVSITLAASVIALPTIGITTDVVSKNKSDSKQLLQGNQSNTIGSNNVVSTKNAPQSNVVNMPGDYFKDAFFTWDSSVSSKVNTNADIVLPKLPPNLHYDKISAWHWDMRPGHAGGGLVAEQLHQLPNGTWRSNSHNFWTMNPITVYVAPDPGFTVNKSSMDGVKQPSGMIRYDFWTTEKLPLIKISSSDIIKKWNLRGYNHHGQIDDIPWDAFTHIDSNLITIVELERKGQKIPLSKYNGELQNGDVLRVDFMLPNGKTIDRSLFPGSKIIGGDTIRWRYKITTLKGIPIPQDLLNGNGVFPTKENGQWVLTFKNPIIPKHTKVQFRFKIKGDTLWSPWSKELDKLRKIYNITPGTQQEMRIIADRTFNFEPDKFHKIEKLPDGREFVSGSFKVSDYKQTIVIPPLPNLIVTGKENHGEVNIQSVFNNIPAHIKKPITVKVNGLPTQSTIIRNLSSGDKITFTYKPTLNSWLIRGTNNPGDSLTRTFIVPNLSKRIVIQDPTPEMQKSLSGINGFGSVKIPKPPQHTTIDIKIKRKGQTTFSPFNNTHDLSNGDTLSLTYKPDPNYAIAGQFKFNFIVSGLNDRIRAKDPFQSFNITGINKHGSFNLPPADFTKNLTFSVDYFKSNGSPTANGRLENGDKIRFTYKPIAGLRIDPNSIQGATMKSNGEMVIEHTVSNLLGIILNDPTKKMFLSGIENHGVLNFGGGISVPNNTHFFINLIQKDGTVTSLSKNSTQVQNLSNGDKVEFIFRTFDSTFNFEPKKALPIRKLQSGAEEVRFIFNVNNLLSTIVIPPLPKLTVTGSKNHGTLDISSVLAKIPSHTSIKVEINGQVISGNTSVLDNLKYGDVISFIYTPDSGFTIQGEQKGAPKTLTFIVPKLKGIVITDPTKNMVATGKNGSATISPLPQGIAHTHLKIQFQDVNGKIKTNGSLSNGDYVIITYTPDPTYFIDSPNDGNNMVFRYHINGLTTMVDVSRLSSFINFHGTNKNPIIDINQNANIPGMDIVFGFASSSQKNGKYYSKNDFLDIIRKTQGQWKLDNIVATYKPQSGIKISFKNNKLVQSFSNNSIQMIINDLMMQKVVKAIEPDVTFGSGSNSSSVKLRFSNNVIVNLENKYGLKMIFSNDGGKTWQAQPPQSFNPQNPNYWIKLVPSGNGANNNDASNTLKFENVKSNIIKMDVTKIPQVIKIFRKTLDEIQNTKITGSITSLNAANNWLINGSQQDPKWIQDLLQKHTELEFTFLYDGVKFKSITSLLQQAKLDKDSSSDITIMIGVKKSIGNSKFEIQEEIVSGSSTQSSFQPVNNNVISIDVSISSMIQTVDLSNLKGEDFVHMVKSQTPKHANISLEDTILKSKIMAHIDAKLLENINGNFKGFLDLALGKKFFIQLAAAKGWNFIPPESTSNQNISSWDKQLVASLTFDNPIIKSVSTSFEKFNGKGKISNSVNLIKTDGSSASKSMLEKVEIKFSQDNGKTWMNAKNISNLTNGDKLIVWIKPKDGYKMKHVQPKINLTVQGLFNEIDASKVQIDKTKLKFTGFDSKGSVVPGTIAINGLLNDLDKVTIHFVIKDAVTNKVKFNGQLMDSKGKIMLNNLSVGDKVFGFFEVKDKYAPKFALSNNPTNQQKLIDMGIVNGLKVHPSVLGKDSSKDALLRILKASLNVNVGSNGKSEITIKIDTKNRVSVNVPKNEHWHWTFWTKSNPQKILTSKIGEILNLIKNADVPNETIFIGVEADQNYVLDNVNASGKSGYTPWSIRTSKLKSSIDVSKLKPINLDIHGINGSADIRPFIKLPSGDATFTPPAGTHLVYGKIASTQVQTIKTLNSLVKTWVSDPRKLNIVVGESIVAKLVTSDSNTILSQPFFTPKPTKAFNLIINMSKIIGAKINPSGFNRHGDVNISVDSKSDPNQVKGVEWRIRVNGGKTYRLNELKNAKIKNGDLLELIPFAKPGYIMPKNIGPMAKITVSGLKEAIITVPNLSIKIDDDNIVGTSVDGKEVSLKSGVIVNGKAKLKDVSIFRYKNGNYDDQISMNDLSKIKAFDETKNEIKGIKFDIKFTLNGGKPSKRLPSLLKNGDVVKAFLVISDDTPKSLRDKYGIADGTVGALYSKLISTYKVHGLAEKAPKLTNVKIIVPELKNGSGTVIVTADQQIPAGFGWKYKIKHKDGKTTKWTSDVPKNLKNDDIVSIKLAKNDGTPVIPDYFQTKTIKGLIMSVSLGPELEKMIGHLSQNMKFKGDNHSGAFDKNTIDEISKINDKLREHFKEDVKISLKLQRHDDNLDSINSDVNILSNKDHILISLTGGNVKLSATYSSEVNGLKEADDTVNKTLMWGIIAGVLGVFTLGAGFIIYKLVGKRKLK